MTRLLIAAGFQQQQRVRGQHLLESNFLELENHHCD